MSAWTPCEHCQHPESCRTGALVCIKPDLEPEPEPASQEQETFFDAVMADPDIPAEKKAYWLYLSCVDFWQRIQEMEAALRDLYRGAEQQSQSHADVMARVSEAIDMEARP